jgi:hypothetical protein
MWANFFSASASASAALAGLVFVAISVNIQSLLKYPHLVARAGATIGALILILVASIAALAPQGERALGVEIAGFGVLGWILSTWSARHALRARKMSPRLQPRPAISIAMGQLQVLPFVTGGALMAAGLSYGIRWVEGGVLLTFIFSVVSAWVLLVEILR